MNNNSILATKKLADAYNRKDWVAFADLLAPNAVYEAPDVENGGVIRCDGRPAILAYMQDWSAVVPDDRANFTSVKLIDSETVSCEVVWSGTRSGESFELRGVTLPANGAAFENRGSTIYKVQSGKIVRISDHFDVAEFIHGLDM